VVTKTETCHLQSVYDREQIALASLTAAIFDSIPAATKQACTGYDIRFGSSFIPLPTMMQHVTNKYGDASVFSYQEAKTALMHPYANGDIDEFLAAQVSAHHQCARTGNPLNTIEKVTSLIAALGGVNGLFSFTIAKFEEDTRGNLAYRTFEDLPAKPATDTLPAQPARDGLATRIRQAAPRVIANMGANGAPTTSGYYGAAAVATHSSPQLRDAVIRALQEVLPSMLATALAGAPPPTSPATAPVLTSHDSPHDVPPAGTDRNLYCWTHGLGGHTSIDCVNRAPGHEPRATITRRMGGTNRNCPK